MGLFRHRHEVAVPAAAAAPSPKKKLGVAFGGGGLKGAAHIGVLKVLDEYGVNIDMQAGTSIGSAIAALNGAGYDWRMMKMLFENYDIESLLKVRPGRKGLIPGDGYTEMIRTCTKGLNIEQLRLPTKVVAVDLISRKRILFDKGDTALAVRASSAIPGVFTPVEMGDMVLVDGYVLDNCPGNVVRQMGADVVLAIDLYSPDCSSPSNMLEIVSRSLDVAAHAYQPIDADLILHPIQHYMESLDPNNITQCFAWGEECARAHIDEILALLRA